MRPPIRTQVDSVDDNELNGMMAVTVIESEDMTRQEFANEANINWLLKKYGAVPPVVQFPTGEIDFDLDLLTAKTALLEAHNGYRALPQTLRDQLSFSNFLNALADGSFTLPRPSGEPSAGSSGEGSTEAPTGGRQ